MLCSLCLIAFLFMYITMFYINAVNTNSTFLLRFCTAVHINAKNKAHYNSVLFICI